MRKLVIWPALGMGLLLLGMAVDRYLIPRFMPASVPSTFLTSFDALDSVMRHLNGAHPARISQLTGGDVRAEQGVFTKCTHLLCSDDSARGMSEIKAAMEAIGADIAAQVTTIGGTSTCNDLGWGIRPAQWGYEVGGHRGVVSVLVLRLNQPSADDLPANMAVLVQVVEI